MEFQRINNNTWIVNNTLHGKNNVLATYLIESDKPVIIDPGAPAQTDKLIKELEKRGIRTDIIALTHIHLDHASGSWMMVEKNPDITIYVHPRGTNHLIDPTNLLKAAEQQFKGNMPEYGTVLGVKKEYIKETREGQTIDLGNTSLEVMWTPGHSTHSQSFFEPKNKMLFAGDAAGHIINDVAIPASPPPFNPKQSIESIDKMIDLNPQTICISHYGFKQNAVKYLEEYRKKVEAWESLSLEAVKNKLDLRGYYNLIYNKDTDVQELVASNPETKGNVYSSLVGFLSYAKWVSEK